MLDQTRDLRANLRRTFLALLALLSFFVLAAVAYRRLPSGLQRKYGIRTLSASESPKLKAEVEALSRRLGLAAVPEVAVRPGFLNGLAIQGERGPCLVIDGEPERLERVWGDLHRAVVAHELGHIANHDIWNREIARSAGLALAFLLPVTFGVGLVRGKGLGEPLLWRTFGLVTVLALLWGGLVRAREFYADAQAVRVGLGPALQRRLQLPASTPRSTAIRWRMHPTNCERVEHLQRPEKLFRVSRRLAFLTGMLAGLIAGSAGGLLHDGFLVVNQVFSLLGLFSGKVAVLVMGVICSVVLMLAALGILSYGISAALGLQTLRAAVADRLLKPRGHWGYGVLAVPALCFVAGVETGALFSSFSIPSLAMLPTAILFQSLFTAGIWTWLMQVRAAGRWFLASSQNPKGAIRSVFWLRLLASFQLMLILWPALLGRLMLGLESLPQSGEELARPEVLEKTVFLLTSSAFVVLALGLSVTAVSGLCLFFLVLLGVLPTKVQCAACGYRRRSRFAVGRRCEGCGIHLGSWLTTADADGGSSHG